MFYSFFSGTLNFDGKTKYICLFVEMMYLNKAHRISEHFFFYFLKVSLIFYANISFFGVLILLTEYFMMRKFIKTTFKNWSRIHSAWCCCWNGILSRKKHIIKIQTKEIRKECISILNFVFNIRFTMIYWKKCRKKLLKRLPKIQILKYECDK